MLEELMLERYYGGGVDMGALIAFFATAALYFLAPVVGYGFQRRASMMVALYLFIANIGISAIQFGLFWMQVIGAQGRGGAGGGPFGMGGGESFFMYVYLLSGTVKTALFMLALLALVIGLQSLRFRPPQSQTEPPPYRGEP